MEFFHLSFPIDQAFWKPVYPLQLHKQEFLFFLFRMSFPELPILLFFLPLSPLFYYNNTNYFLQRAVNIFSLDLQYFPCKLPVLHSAIQNQDPSAQNHPMGIPALVPKQIPLIPLLMPQCHTFVLLQSIVISKMPVYLILQMLYEVDNRYWHFQSVQ